MLLSVSNLTVHYGKAVALENVSMEVAEGSVVTLVGANGAGKTTLLRTMSGLIPATSGEIWFRGTNINGLPAPKIVALGLVHIPQGRRLFPYLTVYEQSKTRCEPAQGHAGDQTGSGQRLPTFPTFV